MTAPIENVRERRATDRAAKLAKARASGESSVVPIRPPEGVSPAERHALITKVAFGRAESRGFEPGHDLDDWLAAEKEVDAWLAATRFSGD